MPIDVLGHVGRHGARPASAEALRRHLDQCGLDALLVSNLDAAETAADLDEVDANLACLEACRIDERLTPVYWCRPGRHDSHVNTLVGALASEPFAAALLAPGLNPRAYGERVVDGILSALGRAGYPLIFLCARSGPGSPQAAAALARRHANVPVILAGGAQEAHWHAGVEVLRRGLEAREGNLYVATTRAAAGEVAAFVRRFGAERVLYGSGSAGTGGDSAERQRAWLEELRSATTADAFAQIVEGNARRLFRLHAPARSR